MRGQPTVQAAVAAAGVAGEGHVGANEEKEEAAGGEYIREETECGSQSGASRLLRWEEQHQ